MTTTTKKAMTKRDMKEIKKSNPKLAAFIAEREKEAKAEAERIANLKGFDKLVHDTQVKAIEANNRVKEIQQELEEAKKVEKEIRKEIQHMKAIQKMAGWAEGNSMKWYKEESTTGWRDSAWKYYWKLVTTTLDLYISVSERTDMKKFKYEVSVSGHSTNFQGDPNSFNGGTYKDHDAIKKVNHTWGEVPGSSRYDWVPNEGALESTKKFAKLEDAETYAKQWMKAIDTHYKQALKKDRDMLKQAMKK